MLRPIRHARSTGCTISYWLAVEKFGIGIPRRNIDRAVARNRFRPGRVGPLIAALARLSREEIGPLSLEKIEGTLAILSFMHEALFGKHPGGNPTAAFQQGEGLYWLCNQIGSSQKVGKSYLGDDLSIVAPFASQAAITIKHAYVGALSPHPKLLRSSDRE
jgi:hypothetical protein